MLSISFISWNGLKRNTDIGEQRYLFCTSEIILHRLHVFSMCTPGCIFKLKKNVLPCADTKMVLKMRKKRLGDLKKKGGGKKPMKTTRAG